MDNCILSFNDLDTNSWLIQIFGETGEIKFNDSIKLSANEFAQEFIKIIEQYFPVKYKQINDIVNSDKYKNTQYCRFADKETQDFVKARLFDDICKICSE